MGLYLGNLKKKIKLGDTSLRVNYTTSTLLTTESIMLTTIDGYILKDSVGKYLSVEGE